MSRPAWDFVMATTLDIAEPRALVDLLVDVNGLKWRRRLLSERMCTPGVWICSSAFSRFDNSLADHVLSAIR
eukprot:5190890-Prorocentrum_lima.AAC.1